jgi:hypothetical protein
MARPGDRRFGAAMNVWYGSIRLVVNPMRRRIGPAPRWRISLC